MTDLRIHSGGQTGVDRAALDAALSAGVSCGGWCPSGRRAEDGPIDLIYPLNETASDDYSVRTVANVTDSDATLVILAGAQGHPGEGTALTIHEARKAGRPLLIADLAEDGASDAWGRQVADWIIGNQISILNIAGPRESECPGIYDVARTLIAKMIKTLIRSRS
jgi:hypothetical protein